MRATDLAIDAFSRIEEDLTRIVAGLTVEQLRWQPRPDANPIGWLVWHLTRVQDAQISHLAGQEQAWIAEGWAERFGRPPAPRDLGFGDTPEQVAAFNPVDGDTLLAYYRAVWARTRAYLESCTDEALDRVLNEPRWNPMPTVGVRIVSTINDCTQHVGQAAYVRGLLEGRGWQRF
ncbi:MAG: DUF664 domain-containing protein [Chloroflexota bacterium]|nr:DinB family protein [Dehalococcoidia bacterium]MDW8254167.1 DUF664 domain-containing protein [Chloroflexota bacterium]